MCSDGQEDPPSWVCLSGQLPLGYSHPACCQKACTAWTLTPSARPPLTLPRLCLHMMADPPSQQNFSNWWALNPATHTHTRCLVHLHLGPASCHCGAELCRWTCHRGEAASNPGMSHVYSCSPSLVWALNFCSESCGFPFFPSTNVYLAFILAVKYSERKRNKLCIQYKMTMKGPELRTNFVCTQKIKIIKNIFIY